MPVNLIDPKAIDQYLERLLPNQPEAARLLKLALAKPLAQRERNLETLRELPEDAPDWLKRKWPEGGPYHRFKPDHDLDQQARHVADWIAVAVSEREPWVDRVDTGSKDKKPFRFNDIHTLDDAYREADKDMRERNRRLAKDLAPDGEGEQTVMTLGDGFRIVQLTTPAALDREGVQMGHCIGQGAYDEGLGNGSSRFYSLRDARGEPHTTLEVRNEDNALVQCQGKENKPPIARYLPQIAAFVEQQKFHLEAPACHTGLVESDGHYYSVYHLPENLIIKGDLDLAYTQITSLPEGLKVAGSLYLSGTQITSLPEGLKVDGDLFLSGTPITSLPNGLKIGRSLYLSGTKITSLPEGLNVGGNLDLEGTQIIALSKRLKVGGDLYLSGTRITSLPEDLKVDGDLYLEGSNVREIPPDAKIGGLVFGFPKGMAEKLGTRKVNPTKTR